MRFAAAAVFLLALAMLLPRLGDSPLAGTEGHRALSAQEMVQSGQWLVPHLYGRPYLRKPPLHYWALATTQSIVGYGNELIWRIPTAVEYAGLAALVAWGGGRFFGVRGAWGAGVAYLSIVPLWSQGRTADIDTLNNLTATLCAIALLMSAGTSNRWRGWVVVAGGAMGACLLTKGPAGLPIIIGTMVATVALDRRASTRLRLGRIAITLGIGGAIAALYTVAVVGWLRQNGVPVDRAALVGVREGLENFRPDSARAWAMALAVPLLLAIYAMPASAAGLILLRPSVRTKLASDSACVVSMILLGVAVAWLLGLATGMHNARYGYPTLPLLALLGGALWSGLPAYSDRQRSQLRGIVALAMVGFVIATIGFAAWSWRHGESRAVVVTIIGIALAVGGNGVFHLLRRRSVDGARALLVLVPLLTIAMANWHVAERTRKSGIHAAAQLRAVVGEGNPCVAGAMLRFQPELFHYSGVRCITVGEQIPSPADLKAPTWLLLTTGEYESLYKREPLRHVIPFQSHTEKGYLVYRN